MKDETFTELQSRIALLERRWVERMRDAGLTYKQAAELAQCSHIQIRHIADRHGIKLKCTPKYYPKPRKSNRRSPRKTIFDANGQPIGMVERCRHA